MSALRMFHIESESGKVLRDQFLGRYEKQLAGAAPEEIAPFKEKFAADYRQTYVRS
jgi:hypothetical protein